MTATEAPPAAYNDFVKGRAPHDIIMDAIDKRRQELGWNWSELSRRAGMSRQHVDNIRKNPDGTRLNTIQRLMDALGLTLMVVGVPGFDPDRGRDGETRVN